MPRKEGRNRRVQAWERAVDGGCGGWSEGKKKNDGG